MKVDYKYEISVLVETDLQSDQDKFKISFQSLNLLLKDLRSSGRRNGQLLQHIFSLFRYSFVGGILEVPALSLPKTGVTWRGQCGGRGGLTAAPHHVCAPSLNSVPPRHALGMLYSLSAVVAAVSKPRTRSEENNYIGKRFLGFSL